MRYIQFRGKTSDGRWHEGDLLTIMGGVPRIVHDGIEDENGDISYYDGQGETFFVDVATVSEFTGLYDKNGTKIYEGDIVKAEVGLDEYKGIVKYNKERAMFFVVCFERDKRVHTDKLRLGCEYITEVIGNKWDNSELLEE